MKILEKFFKALKDNKSFLDSSTHGGHNISYQKINRKLLTIKSITGEQLKTWDNEIINYKGNSTFLAFSWLDGLKDQESNPVFFKFFEETTCVGMISGLERPIKGTNKKYMFFYSGIAFSKDRDLNFLDRLKLTLLDFASKNQYFRIVLKSYDYEIKAKANIKKFHHFLRNECIINLNDPEDDIIRGFTKNVRRNVRNSKKKDVTFKIGNSEFLLEKLFELMELTKEIRTTKGYSNYRSLTMPLLGKKEMNTLLKTGSAKIFYAEQQGNILTAEFVVISNNRAYGIYMGSSSEAYKLSCPSLVFYESTLHLKKSGFRSYNLGGVPIGSQHDGVRRFKLDMGSQLVESYEEYTDFLLPPLKKLNHFLRFRERVLEIKFVPWKIKKIMLRFMDVFLKGKYHY